MGKDITHRQVVKRFNSFEKKRKKVGKKQVAENQTVVNFATRAVHVPTQASDSASTEPVNHRHSSLPVSVYVIAYIHAITFLILYDAVTLSEFSASP
jgi:hypothetical protein